MLYQLQTRSAPRRRDGGEAAGAGSVALGVRAEQDDDARRRPAGGGPVGRWHGRQRRGVPGLGAHGELAVAASAQAMVTTTRKRSTRRSTSTALSTVSGSPANAARQPGNTRV